MLEELLISLEEVVPLEQTKDLLVWRTSLNILAREERFAERSAYVRSRTTVRRRYLLI